MALGDAPTLNPNSLSAFAAPPSANNSLTAATAIDGVRGAAMMTPVSDDVRQMQMAQTVRALFLKARDARRPLVARWKRNYQVLNNKMWTPRAEAWMPSPEVADIWPLIASMVAWMTDQRPGCEVTAAAPPFDQYADFYDSIAEDMNSLMDASFSVNQEDAEIERMLWDVLTYSVGYLKTGWEPWLADGLGDSAMRRIDPFSLYPDPWARTTREANFLIEAKIMSMDDLDRAFPGAGNKVMPGTWDDVDQAPHQTDQTVMPGQPRVNMGPLAPSTTFTVYNRSARASNAMISEDPVVVVLEAWIRTHRVITSNEDPSLAPGQAKVQDRWKCIVVCGNTVLMEKFADEIYATPTHPYSKMTLFDTGDWYGPCLVEFLTSPQESINRMLQSIEHNLLLLGNPIMLEGRKANVGGRPTISNRPGQRLPGSKNDVGFMDPPVIHPDFMNLVQYYENKLETISGLSAIMKGFTTTGRNSTDVVSSLQDSAFVRVRATLRNLERCLRDAGSKSCAMKAEFYTEPRLVSVLGDQGKMTAKSLRARHFYNLPDPANPSDPTAPLRFSLLMDAGADHPTSRQARQSQAERLFALAAIDEIALLEAEHWPNWPVVAKRVQDSKAAGLMQPAGQGQRARAQ